MQQEYQIKWNNWSNVFQSALSKYYQQQKFLDAILVIEDGNHTIQCHKMVLDSCSEYFANIFKNKFLEDKNITPVICLPKEIRLWEMQAILSYMYNGEVCISHEGLSSLVKCAEILKVKGLCDGATTSIKHSSNNANDTNDNLASTQEIEIDDSDALEIRETDYREQQIKKEVFTSKTPQKDNHQPNSELMKKQQTERYIRVKKNLFENRSTEDQNGGEKGLKIAHVYAQDVEVGNSTDSLVYSKEHQSPTSHDIQENIVCSPELMQYIESDKESFLTERNAAPKVSQCEDDDAHNKSNTFSNQALYELISQKFSESMCDDEKDGEGNFMMSKNNDNDSNALTDEQQKSSIGGLFLRNPRGNQTRHYDVNALYSALEDVRKGISIYRAAQTYSIPRKTLRNWMKRLHIKSHFPMPKQLQQAAERKKNIQKTLVPETIFKMEPPCNFE